MAKPDTFIATTQALIAEQEKAIEALERLLSGMEHARVRGVATLEALMMTLAVYQEKHPDTGQQTPISTDR